MFALKKREYPLRMNSVINQTHNVNINNIAQTLTHGVKSFVVYANSLVRKKYTLIIHIYNILNFVLFGSIKLLGQIISLFTASGK